MDVFKLFRRLIFASVLIMAANFVAIFVEPDPPEAITDYLMADGAGAYLQSLLESESRGAFLGFALFGLAFLVGWLAALAGMCFFKPWSRPLFILIAIIGLLMLPLMGTSLHTPIQGTLDTLFYMVDGALLALLFVEPIRGRFQPTQLTHG